MLEWARAWETLDAIEKDVERFVGRALAALRGPESTSCEWRGERVQLRGKPWERLSVREALFRYFRMQVPENFDHIGVLAAADRAHVEIPASFRDDRSYVMSFLLDALTPFLGKEVPTFLREWPSFMTSSAELVPGRPELACRSELFIAGLEIADGFPFLRDGALQRQLFLEKNLIRKSLGKDELPLDEAYLQSLEEGIPPGAGMALGVDRLAMVMTGAPLIRDVLPFTWDEL
jgi:lysyl-tRNA synthetase class 2